MLIESDYFKNIFNTVREPILILDGNLKVLSANQSFFNIFKVDSANTIGTYLYDLGNGQWNVPALRVLLEDILPKKTSVENFTIEHNFESIGQKAMLLNACKITEKTIGQPIILLAIEDITERKRMEVLLADENTAERIWLVELLMKSEERYRRIFETANDGIVLLEKSEGTIAHVNPATEKMLGYTKHESIGKKLQDIGISLDTSDMPTIIQALDKSGIINYKDVPIKTKSGQHIDADIYMVNKAELAQCNIRDVSDQKKAEEDRDLLISELDIKNRELEQILYAATHDLKTPLVNINGYTGEVKKSIEGIVNLIETADISSEIRKEITSLTKELPDSFGFISTSVSHMDILLNGFLQFSRSGSVELKKEDIDMNMLINEISGNLNYKLKDAGASIEVTDLPGCNGDRKQISMVFSNLMENAVKYLDPARKGEIKVTGYEEGDSSVYCVEDNGIGIALEHQKQIFHIFHQLDPAKGGEGLGLMIVQRIVERHGGKVWLESEAGKGSRFFVELPGVMLTSSPS
ncbi:MAG: ATP-binding protein [Thermodesulfovibrionia bacterium]|nr:ATP-binding protein [Thermodesulfovibrionia bacterium]